MNIKFLQAYQIYDSRGVPTIEAEVILENGVCGRGLVPSGASTGQFEALELRDGDATRFRGKGVTKAIQNIEGEILATVRGRDVFDQRGLDEALISLDGTPNKSRLGANAILAVSMATVQAAANARGIPLFKQLGDGDLLPLPEIQIIGGGAHANWRTDVQDFLIIATGAKSYAETLEMTHNVYHATGDLLKKRGKFLGLSDEGGYWPDFASHEEILDTLVEGIQVAGYKPGSEVAISLDIAASDLYEERTKTYRFQLENRTFTSEEFAEVMIGWCEQYPIISIEDPMADIDTAGWKQVRAAIGHRVQLIGDDLFTTNSDRIRKGVADQLANAVLIKLNQIGTVTETIDAIRLTQNSGWLPIVSARSGETEDAFIAHLAVATNAGQLKVGSFARSERMAKWNELLRIEQMLGRKAKFIGSALYKKLNNAQ